MKSKKLRDSARGQECAFGILGVCNGNPETTVLCHLPSNTGGMGLKSSDECAAFGCYNCHQVIDGHVQSEEFSERAYFYYYKALTATLNHWVEEKIFNVKGAK